MMGRLIRNPKIPAPRKFQNPTATRNMTAQRCGNGVRERDSCLAPSCKKLHASTVRNVRGMTSAAEKNAPRAMCSAGVPEKYRWCMVPITPPAEYSNMSRKMTVRATFSLTTPSNTKM
jgi:hypothetical protein